MGRATAPGELHADVVGRIVPMGIGRAKYILVAVDELTRYTWVFPMRKKSQTARLLALLIQRINNKSGDRGNPGCAACIRIKVVSASHTHLRNSTSGKASSTPSPAGHSTSPMA